MKFAALLMIAFLTHQESPFTESEVYGEWAWFFSKGGLMDHTITPEKVKASKKLVLTKDHVAMFFVEDSLTLRKNYQIQSEKTVFSESFRPVFRLAGMQKTQMIALIGKDTLELKDNAFDGYTHRYVRVK